MGVSKDKSAPFRSFGPVEPGHSQVMNRRQKSPYSAPVANAGYFGFDASHFFFLIAIFSLAVLQ